MLSFINADFELISYSFMVGRKLSGKALVIRAGVLARSATPCALYYSSARYAGWLSSYAGVFLEEEKKDTNSKEKEKRKTRKMENRGRARGDLSRQNDWVRTAPRIISWKTAPLNSIPPTAGKLSEF